MREMKVFYWEYFEMYTFTLKYGTTEQDQCTDNRKSAPVLFKQDFYRK